MSPRIWRNTLSSMVVACGLLCTASASHAQVTTLFYTGNPFTFVTAPYTTSDYISATFVFDGLLPQNANLQPLTLSSFSVTDQHQTLTQAATFSISSLSVTTDAATNIVGWYFNFSDTAGTSYISSLWNPTAQAGGDTGLLMSDVLGQNTDTPGQWQVSVDNGGVVPEPATLALFGLGLAGAGIARRRKRKA